jgi:hypothetical protein
MNDEQGDDGRVNGSKPAKLAWLHGGMIYTVLYYRASADIMCLGSICNPSSLQLSICLTTQVTPSHKPRSPRRRCSRWPLRFSLFHRGSSSWHRLYANESLLLLKRENMSLKHEWCAFNGSLFVIPCILMGFLECRL